MSEEITVGAVLGGRYLVTAEVVATAEGDSVFDATDQVLNRPVSLLIAAPSNATRVAVSAREIAMGTRPSQVQVLDLGLNGDSTYLIANKVDPASLLDLVVEPDAPYIEPFMTDTLGQEIFGEARSMEPQVYEDDAEYYQELAEEQRRRPLFGRRKPRNQPADEYVEDASTASQPVIPPVPSAPPVSGSGAAAPMTGPFASTPTSAADAAAAAATAAASASVSDASSLPTELGEVVPAAYPPVTPLPPHGVRSADDVAREAAARGDAGRAAGRFPREALGGALPGAAAGSQAGAQAPAAPAESIDSSYGSEAGAPNAAAIAAAADDVLARVPAQPERRDDSGNRLTRPIVGIVLVAVLVGAVIFAMQALGNRNGNTVATPTTGTTQSSNTPTKSSDGSKSPTPAAAKPVIESISRDVPGSSDLNAEMDGDLPKAIDGKSSTSYRTFSFKSPAFGGYAKNMVLVLKLEKSADISSVNLSGLNGTGGSVQVLIGKNDSMKSAQEVWSGSFSGSTLDTPTVNGGEPATGQYVFINITELPRLATATSQDRPFGFQVAEIKVN